MAAIGTNTETFTSPPTSFTPLFLALTNTASSTYSEGELYVWPAAESLYFQRVWDSGSGGRWCYYSKPVVDASPLSTETTPNYTGAISVHSVVRPAAGG